MSEYWLAMLWLGLTWGPAVVDSASWHVRVFYHRIDLQSRPARAKLPGMVNQDLNPKTDITIPRRYGQDEDHRVREISLTTRGLKGSFHIIMEAHERNRESHVSGYFTYDDVAALVLAGRNWLEVQSR